jgi:general secretion pathway protein E
VYELIVIDDKLRAMVHDHQPEPQLKKYARTLFPSIRQDGYKRVLAGHTSLEEVIRVTSEE